jgi:hypothetical protein
MDELFKKIDAEKENRFKKPWTKLDKESKLDRLLLFIKMQKTENHLSDNQENQLKTLVLQLYSKNMLNKTIDIGYDRENSIIVEIMNLNFDENTKKYSFLKSEKKNSKKSSSQTPHNSNIERHFNRSKKSNKSNKTL